MTLEQRVEALEKALANIKSQQEKINKPCCGKLSANYEVKINQPDECA